MSDLPAFLETEPDSFKPIEECSREEIASAAEATMAHAVMSMREAVEQAETEGVSPMSQGLASRSEEQMRTAKALQRLAGLGR